MSKVKEGNKKRKKKKPQFTVLKNMWRLFSFLIIALFIWIVYCYTILLTNPFTEPVQKADTAIVLGAALWNNRPSPALRERLNHALSLYNEELVKNIVVSGGKGSPNQIMSEAEGMFNYLVEQGVEKDHIVMEEHATNTYENLVYSGVLLDKHSFDSYIIVSHTYHAYRTNQIAKYIGYEDYQVSGVESQVLNKPYHYTREVLAYSKWVLNSFTLKLGLYID